METTILHLAVNFAPAANSEREAQEYLAIEGYRAGTLSHDQASQLLGMSYFAFDAFLKDRHIHEHTEDVPDYTN